ncbi:MAG TPA: sigma-70 family RNA polymerase sigma factor [Candidatus Limnocylindrales bacterium]|jgi:RNA polymerase sigma-70 factor (ECF subfamily)
MDDLPARLAADHRLAFADLVTAHQDLVFGVGLRVTRDAATAEDIAQETFVSAYRALGRYPAERIAGLRLRPWLARIALNTARNELRRRRPSVGDEQLPDAPAPAADEPLSLVQRREAKDLWARLLAGLPDRYRLAVALRHVEGLSYDELAQTLGRPLGSVKSDVHRGVALLRAAYDAEQRRVAQKEAV